jgi:DNA-binding NtrC family response regulator
VRELENILERALAMCDGAIIDTADLLHQDELNSAQTQTMPVDATITADVNFPE